MLVYEWWSTPVGALKLIASDNHLLAVLWPNELKHWLATAQMHQVAQHAVLDLTKQQLTDYFAGKRKDFELPIFFYGTVFQRQVWHALHSIHYGQTQSYTDIAIAIERPKAIRAVAAAIARNPVSIICPCHRVIGRNGHLTGFAGGLENKQHLLQIEQLHA